MCVASNAAGEKKPSHYSDLELCLFSRDDHYLQEKKKKKDLFTGRRGSSSFLFQTLPTFKKSVLFLLTFTKFSFYFYFVLDFQPLTVFVLTRCCKFSMCIYFFSYVFSLFELVIKG